MFGKRKQTGTQATANTAAGPRSEPDLATRAKPAPAGRPAEPVRRAPDQIVAPARRGESELTGGESGSAASHPETPPRAGTNEGRRLVVGRDIRLSGEIKKCDKLVVEGQVEASLTESRALEISETGLFSGDAVVEEAEISGCFEGELTVNGRLHIRATGQVVGTVRYADIEIERGGRIAGSIDVMLPATADDLPQPSAAPAALEDEPEDDEDEVQSETQSEAQLEAELTGGESGNGDREPEAQADAQAEPDTTEEEGPANGASKPLPLMARNRPDART